VKSIRILVMLAATLALTAIAATPATATTVEECQADLATLQDNLALAEGSFTNDQDFARLDAKLVDASEKLAAGKNDDAVRKLDDFQTKLTALATDPKPKVDAAVAGALVTDAQGVIDCIDPINGTA
jgi:hypothetical protein